MANNWAFATLAELKQRIGISVSDTTDDDLLTSLLDLTAGAIESAAGRPLRRCHARTEYFTGGSAVIQLDAYPIAKIHSVRESLTRDFETAGEYEELVEGTDFVVDPGPGGRYGETGQLRRIGGRWAGSKTAPGCVRAVYTGGYKTDAEVEVEKGVVTISAADEIVDFSVGSQEAIVSETTDTLRGGEAAPHYLPVIRFDLKGRLLPTWRITELTLGYSSLAPTPTVYYDVGLFKFLDPLSASLSALLAAVESTADCPVIWPNDAADFDVLTPISSVLNTQEDLDLFFASITSGRVSFFFNGVQPFQIGATRHASPENRPSLTVRHWPTVADPYVTPDDLRNANLLQAVHEYMTRRTPGMISQATRGTMMPSGSSYLKTAADLLPEVQRIALGYRRLF